MPKLHSNAPGALTRAAEHADTTVVLDERDDAARSALRAAVHALRSPKTAKRAAPPDSSIYRRALTTLGFPDVHVATTASVASKIQTVEATARLPGTLLALFLVPGNAPLGPDSLVSYRKIVAAGAAVVVLGIALERRIGGAGEPHQVPLRASDPIIGEWAAVVCRPHDRLACAARPADDDPRSWQWLLTDDSIAAGRAAKTLLDRVPHLGLQVPALH